MQPRRRRGRGGFGEEGRGGGRQGGGSGRKGIPREERAVFDSLSWGG